MIFVFLLRLKRLIGSQPFCIHLITTCTCETIDPILLFFYENSVIFLKWLYHTKLERINLSRKQAQLIVIL